MANTQALAKFLHDAPTFGDLHEFLHAMYVLDRGGDVIRGELLHATKVTCNSGVGALIPTDNVSLAALGVFRVGEARDQVFGAGGLQTVPESYGHEAF